MVQLEVRPTVVPAPEVRALQTVLAVNAILPLPVVELLARVERELEENPVLERVPTPCPQCGHLVEGVVCGRCGHAPWLRRGWPGERRWRAEEDDGRPSALDRAAAPANLLDSLEGQLRVSVRDPAVLRVALHLVGYVDGRGYLDADLSYVAAELRVPLGLVEEALRALQACEPAGVGARDVRECLLLQLDRLPDCPPRRLAREMVAGHLTALARGQHAAVASALGVRVEEVYAALRYLRRNLVAHPAEAFHAEHGQDRVRPEELAVPDVAITRTEDGYRVELVASSAFQLRVHPLVRRALVEGLVEPQERERLRAQVRRARLFVEALRRRNAMVLRCAEYLVRYQRAFLDHGPAHLRPLTLSRLAQELGVWESTVSRALSGKFVQMPDGRVAPFEVFFDSSLPVRERIRELVAAEDPARPLTDEELAVRLRAEGWAVARRTVTKYREMARIPSARVRRRRLGSLPEAAV
jgi:RNA polymerase sigma-54 factor